MVQNSKKVGGQANKFTDNDDVDRGTKVEDHETNMINEWIEGQNKTVDPHLSLFECNYQSQDCVNLNSKEKYFWISQKN